MFHHPFFQAGNFRGIFSLSFTGEVSSLCGLNQGLFRAFLVSKN